MHKTNNYLLYIILFLLFTIRIAFAESLNNELFNAATKGNIAIVKNLLKVGQDPNSNKIFISLSTFKPEIIELLFDNDHKKLNITLYCQYLNNFKNIVEDGFTPILPDSLADSAQVLDKKYKHLNAEPTDMLKIEKMLTHFWATNEKQPKEIPDERIEIIVKNQKTLNDKSNSWQQTVWTFDKSIIPHPVKKLESNGILVRELNEINNNSQTLKIIKLLVKRKLWGMASDLGRVYIIKAKGGFYTDSDYLLTEDAKTFLEKIVRTYDFIGFSSINGSEVGIHIQFFGAKPEHPILKIAEELAIKKFQSKDKVLSVFGVDLSDIRESDGSITYFMTGHILDLPFMMGANLENNIDVASPLYHSKLEGDTNDDNFDVSIIKKYAEDTCSSEISYFENKLRFRLDGAVAYLNNKAYENNEIFREQGQEQQTWKDSLAEVKFAAESIFDKKNKEFIDTTDCSQHDEL